MRVSRSLLFLLVCAFAVGGCAQLSAPRLAAAPPAPAAAPANGIDALAYGAPVTAVPASNVPAESRGLFGTTGPLHSSVAAAPPAADNRPLFAAAALPAPPPAAVAAPRYAPAIIAAAHVPAEPNKPYTLDSGDRLRVVVFGQDGLSNSYLVDASGHIAMPLIGSVSARGLTADELSSRIGERLRQGFVREPHVAVEVEAYRPFFILGEVTQPGQYPYVADMTVETAVAIAGGFGPRASRQTVVVTRTVRGQQIRMTVPTSYPLRPGDTVNVQERWF
ncbi:MAG TPA: polysaccharide biosynthesis/export family protein [Stellaceae bacterium]|nr:polysaccharide biosynthesis/export family protein [Stellaceae bacterium]